MFSPCQWPLPRSPSSCDPPYCPLLTCLSSPLWVPLLLYSFLPHTRHCQPAILFIIPLFFICTWQQIHFFFLILSQWLIVLWNGNAMIFKTWKTHKFFSLWDNLSNDTQIFFLQRHSGFKSIHYKHEFRLPASQRK